MSMPVNENSRSNVDLHPTIGMRSLPNGVGDEYWIKQSVKRNLFQEFVGAGRTNTANSSVVIRKNALLALKAGNPDLARALSLKIIADREIKNRVLLTIAKYYFDNGNEEEGLATCSHLKYSMPLLVTSKNLRIHVPEIEAVQENIPHDENLPEETFLDCCEETKKDSPLNPEWT